MEKRIGIVGCGFVGNAIRQGFSKYMPVQVYDKYDKKRTTTDSFEELVNCCDILFICLPTPMKRTGECDSSLVNTTIKTLDFLANKQDKKKIAVIKSTVPPGTTLSLQNSTSSLVDIIFNPEFLTEANSVEDFINQKRVILGGDECIKSLQTLKKIYMKVLPESPCILSDSIEAELVKYYCNCFLAIKVSFSNEMKQLCDRLGANYDKVIKAVSYDTRIGSSHMEVPGPDGKYGFGGSCFPKDISALIRIMQDNDVSPTITTAAWQKNLEVRPERDWEQLIGRAVVKD